MKKQAGFTLVELAVVLVIIGIILGAVLKGQELINNSKGKRFLNDIKGLEAMLWTYYDRKGRWPGDCDLDGLYEFSPTVAANPATNLSNSADPTTDYCADDPTTSESNVNRAYSDLRSSRIATFESPNIVIGKSVTNGQVHLGQATDGGSPATVVNVMVSYGVPAWMAKMVDVAIDGSAAGDSGRIRRWDTAQTGAAWPGDANNDQTVGMAYFFDRSMP